MIVSLPPHTPPSRSEMILSSPSSRLLAGRRILEVIAPQHAEVAEVEPAVGDHGIGPGLGRAALGLIGRREAALFVVGFRRRLDQGNLALFTVDVEAAVGIADRAG